MMNQYKLITGLSALCLFLNISSGYGQRSGIHTTEGFLFLSNSYSKYLDSVKHKDSFLLIYVVDVFIPLKNFDRRLGLTNLTRTDSLHGICIAPIKNRATLLSHAKVMKSEILNSCYEEPFYSILPVRITYKLANNNWHALPCVAPIRIRVGKKEVEFDYKYFDLDFVKIDVLR